MLLKQEPPVFSGFINLDELRIVPPSCRCPLEHGGLMLLGASAELHEAISEELTIVFSQPIRRMSIVMHSIAQIPRLSKVETVA